MNIIVKESTVVKPKVETPSGSLWLSSLDIPVPVAYHSRLVYFFRPNGAANFFDAEILKAALSQFLVDFYPYAGRLRLDNNGRLEINCSGEGAVFIEAECDGTLDDLGGFPPRVDVTLIPKLDYSQQISTLPLCLIQLTRFKCGGVSLGFAIEHRVADGVAAAYWINTWSDIARGLTTTPPFLDRRLLSGRNPRQPQFPHIEHQPPPSLKTPLDITETTFKTFRLTLDQLKALKEKSNNQNKRSYTTYEELAGHLWRTVCLARGLPHDQETKLQLPVDGRQRLKQQPPPNFLGNVVFYTAALAKCGDIESNPLSYAVGKVHEAIARVDDDYMRSALDFLELELEKPQGKVRPVNSVSCPNIGITSWVRLPFYKADFGWGKPAFVVPGEGGIEGRCYLFVDPENEGAILIAIKLLKPHMELFEKLIYDICDGTVTYKSRI